MKRALLVMTLVLTGCKAEPAKTKAPAPTQAPEPEVLTLNGKPVEASFGLGEGVSFARSDEKRFIFKTDASPVVIAHFKAREIDEGEVVVSVNGTKVANVPPDHMASADRELQALIPRGLLKEGDNALVFQNLRNPPGKQTWRVWGVWLETGSVPSLAPGAVMEEARGEIEAARKLLAGGQVTTEQRLEAWKHYRKAQLLLEAEPERPADLYDEAQRQLKALDPTAKPTP
jgi:hypothetical protein